MRTFFTLIISLCFAGPALSEPPTEASVEGLLTVTKAEAVIESAAELGMRIHAGRGAMSLGRSAGGLPPDDVVQDEAIIVKDCERVIHRFHDAKPYAMTRIDLMPCSPFSITFDLLKETRALAKSRKVWYCWGVKVTFTRFGWLSRPDASASLAASPLPLLPDIGVVGNTLSSCRSLMTNSNT